MATQTLEAPATETNADDTSGKINRSTVRDLFAAGVLNKVAYVALCLRLDQPINGSLQEIDPEQYAEELTFEMALAGGKGKVYTLSPSEVETAIATLQKKGCLQCDKPPVQMTIGLMY